MKKPKDISNTPKGVLTGLLLLIGIGGSFPALMILFVSDMPSVGGIMLLFTIPSLAIGWYLANKTGSKHRRKRLNLALSNPEKYIFAQFKDTSSGKEVILTEHEIFFGEKEHIEFNTEPYKLLRVYVQDARLIVDLRYFGANRYEIRKEYFYPEEAESALRRWRVRVQK